MRDVESEYRVIEMLHAIKIFIETANRMEPEDIKCLEAVAEYIKQTNKSKAKEMTIAEIEKALGYPVKIVKERSK